MDRSRDSTTKYLSVDLTQESYQGTSIQKTNFFNTEYINAECIMSTRICELLLSSTTLLKANWSNARKPYETMADLNEIVEAEVVDGQTLKEESSNCQHFYCMRGRITMPTVFYLPIQ